MEPRNLEDGYYQKEGNVLLEPAASMLHMLVLVMFLVIQFFHGYNFCNIIFLHYSNLFSYCKIEINIVVYQDSLLI